MAKIINPNTPDFIAKERRIEIDRYISENPENRQLIKDTVEKNRAVLIDAPTGSGKSRTLAELLYDWIDIGRRRCFYLLPKLIQQHQLAESYLNGLPVINANATDQDKETSAILGANITWQSFLLGSYSNELTENDIVIIDEAHLLINAQAYIDNLKYLVRTLQQAKYKIILLSGTPNYKAFEDLFGVTTLSFRYKNQPKLKIAPYTISGKLIENVVAYLQTLDFDDNGLHVVRVNDKDKQQEIKDWATERLGLAGNQIQIINKDVADARRQAPDYNFLLREQAIQPEIKLMLTTIFADEAISIKNENLKSIAIFYDPILADTSQRCRDSVIQFCARFRNYQNIEGSDSFQIKLFLPDLNYDTEARDYATVLESNRKVGNFLLYQLISLQNLFGSFPVMEKFPALVNGTNPQANLVIDMGGNNYRLNKQGLYFNTKHFIDKFKSNAEFLGELEPYFHIDEILDFIVPDPTANRAFITLSRTQRIDHLRELFRPLVESPEDVLYSIARQQGKSHLVQLGEHLHPSMQAITNGIAQYDIQLVQAIEDNAVTITMLKTLGFPLEMLAGLLIGKREFKTKMFYLRYLLEHKYGETDGMDKIYGTSIYDPIQGIVGFITRNYQSQGFLLKKDVMKTISKEMSHYLKSKHIRAGEILDELFECEEKRSPAEGKKQTLLRIISQRTITDVVLDLLILHQLYYPSIDGVRDLVDEYNRLRDDFNKAQQASRANAEDEVSESGQSDTLGKIRVKLEGTKSAIQDRVHSDVELQSKAQAIAEEMITRFRKSIAILRSNRELTSPALKSDSVDNIAA